MRRLQNVSGIFLFFILWSSHSHITIWADNQGVFSWSRVFHYLGWAKKFFFPNNERITSTKLLFAFLSFFSIWLWTLIERCGVSKLTNQQKDPFSCYFFKSDVTLSRHNFATYASSMFLKQILPYLAKINRMVLTHQNHSGTLTFF